MRGNLTRVVRGGVTTDFAYDAFGRRISQTVGGVVTRFVMDGARCVSEISPNGRVDAQFGPSGALFRNDRWFSPDNQGTGTLTDGFGQVVQRYQYGTFGQVTASNSQESNPIQFLGGMSDNSGLQFHGGAYYDPQFGRFLQAWRTGSYLGDVGQIFQGYGDCLVGMAMGVVLLPDTVIDLLDSVRDKGLGETVKDVVNGLVQENTDWAFTDDPRRFGQSFCNFLSNFAGGKGGRGGRGGRGGGGGDPTPPPPTSTPIASLPSVHTKCGRA